MNLYCIDTSLQLKKILLNIKITNASKKIHFIPFSSHSFLYKDSNIVYLYDITTQKSIIILNGGNQYIKAICLLKYHPTFILFTFRKGIIKIFDMLSKDYIAQYEDDYGSWYKNVYEIDEKRIILYKPEGKRSIVIDMNKPSISLFITNEHIILIQDRIENEKKYIECKLKTGVNLLYEKTTLSKVKEEKEFIIKGNSQVNRYIIENQIYFVKFSVKEFVKMFTIEDNKMYCLICYVNDDSEEIIFTRLHFNTIYIFTKNSIYCFNEYSEIIKKNNNFYHYQLKHISASNNSTILSSFLYNNDYYVISLINSTLIQIVKNTSLINKDCFYFKDLTEIIINNAIYLIGKNAFFVYDLTDCFSYYCLYQNNVNNIMTKLIFNCFDDLFISLTSYSENNITLIRYNYKERKVIDYIYNSKKHIEQYGEIQIVFSENVVFYEIGGVLYKPKYVVKVNKLYAVLCDNNEFEDN